MDWFIDPSSGGARPAVEGDIVAYLARRQPDPIELADAADRVGRALSGLAPGPTYRLSLRWEDDQARLDVRTVPVALGDLPGAVLAPGATAWAGRVAGLDAFDGPGLTRHLLGMRRPPEVDLDPDPGEAELPAERQGFLSGMAALATGLTGHSPEGCAAFCGAAASRRAEADYRTESGADGPLDATQIATAFVSYQQAIGSDFAVVEASADRAVVVNHTCPFGPAVDGAPHLCRVTSATLGSMAARSAGEASVHLDERIAAGDPHCRLTLQLRPTATAGSAHRYTDPPAGVPDVIDLDAVPAGAGGHGIFISLQLPRDHKSVPVIRHLVRHALTELGVVDDVTGDVELALTEACANVLDHAGSGDAYEVSVAVRGDRCVLRIVDTGHGFDHQSVMLTEAGLDDERGRGLALMHALVDRVHLVSEPERGTLVTMTKHLVFGEGSAGPTLLGTADAGASAPPP
ncbi:MAG TPA: ATP-binding protein [Acidimicrobiales bacterium]|nr:ATP-binding protein [Acidimicrobiales bacterium]